MVDSVILPALTEAIKRNEIGDSSPYCLSFARFGASGASFGVFQGDTNVDYHAQATLRAVLKAAAVPDDKINTLMGTLNQPCPNGNPLSDEDTRTINDALDSASGRQLVDQMDAELLQVVTDELDGTLAAAQKVGFDIDPVAQLYIALWINMTGPPSTLNKWIGGSVELGVDPPPGPTVTPSNITKYLKATRYFTMHPRNFIHMRQSVDIGAQKLPKAQV